MIPSFLLLPSVFAVVTLLLLLLGETALRWYLIGLCALVFLFVRRKLDFLWVKTYPLIAGLWGVFFGLSFLSLFTTHSIPLSLDSLGFTMVSFLLFVIAISSPEKLQRFKNDSLSPVLIFIGCILSVLSFFFLLNRPLAALLPGMNMLYPTFGHNHLAALLLLILPLAWREALTARATVLRRSIFLTALLILNIALLLSFGRAVLVIALVQLAFIWWRARTHIRKQPQKNHLLVWLFPMLFGALSVLAVTKGTLTYWESLWGTTTCPVSGWVGEKTCKPWGREARPLYFSQAWQAIKEYPLTGYGVGAFQLISKKYQQLPFANSSYAHNHFLQVAAESGVITGAVFVALVGALYIRAARLAFFSSRNDEQETTPTLTVNQALFLGALSLAVNALVDFDWSFLGLFSLTLFFLGLVLASGVRFASTPHAAQRAAQQSLSRLLTTAAGVLLSLSLTYGVTELLLAFKQPRLAFAIFPYFKEHMAFFETASRDFSPQERQRLAALYRYHSDFAIASDLFLIDPWRNLTTSNIKLLMERGDWEAADKNFTKLIEVIETADQRFSYHLGYTRLSELAAQRLDIADYFLQHGQPTKAAQYYLWARGIEPWILDHRLPAAPEDLPVEQLAEFLLVAGGSPADWGRHHTELLNWHFTVFLAAVERGDWETAEKWFVLTNERFEYVDDDLLRLGSQKNTNFSDRMPNAPSATE